MFRVTKYQQQRYIKYHKTAHSSICTANTEDLIYSGLWAFCGVCCMSGILDNNNDTYTCLAFVECVFLVFGNSR